MHIHDVLKDFAIAYGAALLVVFLFHYLKQSSIPAFLVAGILIGPWGLSLIRQTESVQVLAEVGVMLLLFSIGLEFSLATLVKTGRAVLIGGLLQVILTTGAVAAVAYFSSLPPRSAIFFGFLLALSSTALVIKMLNERGEMDSPHGRVALGVLILQDLCLVPMIVLMPMLSAPNPDWLSVLRLMAESGLIIVLVVLMARYVFPAFLNLVLRIRSPEILVISSIFLLLLTAWLVGRAGLSLALGAFLAGLILSDSPYSQQIFADIRPFRDGLNSLFFISIGMLVNVRFLVDHIFLVSILVVVLMLGKTLVAGAGLVLAGLPLAVAVPAGASVSQIGEFSFVLLQGGRTTGLVPGQWYDILISAAVITMMITPPLFAGVRKLARSARLASFRPPRDLVPGPEGKRYDDHVIIAGFGISGRNVARVLRGNHIPYVVLDMNAAAVRQARADGEAAYFGDCTSPEVLQSIMVEKARVLVIVISDPFAVRRAIGLARGLNPAIVILCRTKYLGSVDELYELGATEIVAEELEASLELITRILRLYHVPRGAVADFIREIRAERYEAFRDVRPRVPRLRVHHDLDVYTETFQVSAEWPVAGKTILGTDLRARSGAWILAIIREGTAIDSPGAGERLMPGDMVVLIGTKQQLNRALGLVSGKNS